MPLYLAETSYGVLAFANKNFEAAMTFVRKKVLSISILVLFLTGLSITWLVGGFLTAPSRRQSGPLPSDLRAETVKIQSASGSDLSGWFFASPDSNAPVIILMHGVRGCRGDMMGRARFLHEAGYGTLLFDFQAHGESPGKQITFGYLESRDAQAVVEFTRTRNPKAKIGLIGVSMGGAAALLANPPLQVDAMILESVYPDIVRATEDRMVMRLGPVGKIFTPLLTCQLGLRLDISPNQLRPIDGVSKVSVPKYFLAGTEDHQTTLVEANELFAAAVEPKQFWAVEGAGHVNLHAFVKGQYEQRVLAFLAQTLKRDK